MTIELTEEQYKATLTGRMTNVTETAPPTVDIWPYVAELVREKIILPYVLENNLVEIVYRDEGNRYDHVLLPTDHERKFVTIIVDLAPKKIRGHYRLDLGKEYGLL